jgi:hypothetical protein
MAEVHCHAVLCHDQRIALDGSSAEMVEAEAKDLAPSGRHSSQRVGPQPRRFTLSECECGWAFLTYGSSSTY